MEIINSKAIGDLNKFKIVKYLQTHGPKSRVDISKSLKISGPAISKNITALLNANLISEIGSDISAIGRKPVLLEFNKNFRFIIGIDIGQNSIRGVLSNLSGDIICKKVIPSFSSKGAEAVLNQISIILDKILTENNVENNRVSAIGIATPAINDLKTGRFILSSFIDSLDQIDLKTKIEDRFNITTILKNDVDMDIIGERWKGIGNKYKNILYVKLGDGLASRMILNGKLYKGSNLVAGEIGYMILNQEFMREKFSPRGWLEERICNNAVVKNYINKCKKNNIDLQINKENLTISKIIEKLNNGDKLAEEVIQEVISLFSIALVNTISVLDIDVIILGGELYKINDCYIEQISRFMKNYLPFVPKIVTSKLDKFASAIGGVKTVLDEVVEEKIKYLW